MNKEGREMEYNQCKICGANNGRAGILISRKDESGGLCLNCWHTRKSGNVYIDSSLLRTGKELQLTMNQLNEDPTND